VSADPGAEFFTTGVMDVAFTQTYQAFLLIGNQLTQRGSRDQLRTESSRFAVRGAEVQLFDASENLLNEFTIPATGFADQSNGTTPGFGIADVTLIPASVGGGLAAPQTVVAAVKVFGKTLGGETIDSSTLMFPIEICRGCLISFPTDAIDPVSGACAPGGGAASSQDAACLLGQDALVDCRDCCTRVGGDTGSELFGLCNCLDPSAP
jgi:hypothetical protein